MAKRPFSRTTSSSNAYMNYHLTFLYLALTVLYLALTVLYSWRDITWTIAKRPFSRTTSSSKASFAEMFRSATNAWFGYAVRNEKRFRGGLVFKAHRRVYHSNLGLKVIKKKKKSMGFGVWGLGFRAES